MQSETRIFSNTPIRSHHLILVLWFIVPVFIFGQVAELNQLKSAYIEKISRFIIWPDDSTGLNQVNFTISITRETALTAALKSYYKDRTIKGKPVQFVTSDDPNNLEYCHLLLLGVGDKDLLDEYLTAAQKVSALVVADVNGFGKKGVHLNYLLERDRLRIEINLNSVMRDGFIIDSLLLDYARIIDH